MSARRLAGLAPVAGGLIAATVPASWAAGGVGVAPLGRPGAEDTYQAVGAPATCAGPILAGGRSTGVGATIHRGDGTRSGWSPTRLIRGRSGVAVYDFSIGYVPSGLVHAASSSGVFSSADRGRSWMRRRAGPRVFRLSASRSGRTVYGSTYEIGLSGPALQVSRNGGRTWTGVASSIGRRPLVYWLAGPVATDPLDPATVYFGLDYALVRGEPGTGVVSDVIVSRDGGRSWVRPLRGVRGRVRAVAVAPGSPDLAYAGTEAGLFRTVDGGRRWTPVRLPGGRTGVEAVAVSAGRDRRVAVIAGSTLVSGPDGRGWRSVAPRPGQFNETDIAARADGLGFVMAGTRGVFRLDVGQPSACPIRAA